MQQSIDYSNAIPIKKRRFPFFESALTSAEDNPSKSGDKKEESTILDEGFPVTNAKDLNNPDKPRQSSFCVSEVTDTNIGKLAQDNLGISVSEPRQAETKSGPIDDFKNKVDFLSSEVSAKPASDGRTIGAPMIVVKQEIVSGGTKGTCNVELSMGSREVDLSLKSKEALFPSLGHQNSETSSRKSEKSNNLSLGSAASDAKVLSRDCNGNTVNNSSSQTRANRSNWDLNTSMDEWEASTINDAHGFVDVSGFSTTSSILYIKPSLTTSGTVDRDVNRGKHVLPGKSSSSCNASGKPSQQCIYGDSLGLSLAMPCRQLDATREQSSLSEKHKAAVVSQNINLQKAQPSTKVANVSSCRYVKSEPVDENSKHDCSIDGSSSNMGPLKFSSVKRELAANPSFQTVLQSSANPQKSDDHRSIKSELVQEANNEDHRFADSMQHQYVEKVMQHQESSASSSALSVTLAPQRSCPSKVSTSLDPASSGDFPDQPQHLFHSEENHSHKDSNELIGSIVPGSSIQDSKQPRRLDVENTEKFELTKDQECPLESCESDAVAANDEGKINMSAEMLENDIVQSEYELNENCATATSSPEVQRSCNKEANICNKDEVEIEEGEIRELVQHSSKEDKVVEEKKSETEEIFDCDSGNLQPSVSSSQTNQASDYDEKAPISENHDETHSEHIKECVIVGCEPCIEDNSLQKLSDRELDSEVGEKRSIFTPDEQLDLSEHKDVEIDTGGEVSSDEPTSGGHETWTGILDKSTDTIVKEICLQKQDSTSSRVETSTDGNDVVKVSNNAGSKSRIITLPRASVATTSCRTKSIPSRLLTSRSGKERYSDFDGKIRPRGNREEAYTDGPNEFAKDGVHDSSFRNSRPSFMRGNGRGSGRFGPLRTEWNSDNDFAPETYNGPSDYRLTRRRHTSSVADVELEYNGYGIRADGTAFANSRRKGIGDEKFMRHLPNDMMDPVYAHPQTMYDDFDGHNERGNRDFSTMHRKDYHQIRQKSPVRSRTRSPSPWSSRRRRSPHGLPEFTQHRSPAMYRMRRMRSPDRTCSRDEIVSRRHGSPSYVNRHPNDFRDADPGREPVHPRPVNSDRRSPPARFFSRNVRRADPIDSRERGDGSVDERRKFIERRGPLRSFRPNYSSDNDNFRFHINDGPRPYRFAPDTDTEFAERSNMREREFDGRIRHQPLVASRRIRDIEEQQDGSFRPNERVWHDDGYSDVSGLKRRRF